MLLATTKDDAHTNYLKNRGQPGQWFQHKADYCESQPIPRIRNDGFEIVEKLRPTIGDLILPNKFQAKHEVNEPENIHIRLTTEEAYKIADKFNNQPDKWFDFGGNLNYKPPPRPKRLYTETALEMAEANYQQRSHDWFMHGRPRSASTMSYASTGPDLETVGYKLKTCYGQDANDIRNKMRSSHAEEWFRTWSKKDVENAAHANIVEVNGSTIGRVKYEGVDNANRAKGVGSELLIHNTSCPPTYDSQSLPYRCNTADAGDNCRTQSQGSQMARCLGKGSSRSSSARSRPVDRVTNDEAREYLDRNRKGMMNMAIQGTSVSVKPKVRPEGEEFYLRNRGAVGAIIDQSQNTGYKSPAPKARITSLEAQHAADINKGVMSSIVGDTEYRNPRYHDKHLPKKVNTEDAKEIARKSMGSSMKQLVENYRLAPEPAKPLRRGNTDEENGNLKRSVSVGQLLVNVGNKKVPPDVPPIRIWGEEANAIAQKYRGRELFKTIQQQPPSH